MRKFIGFISLIFIFCTACQTKSGLRQEQEVEKLKAEVRQVRGERADMDTAGDELKMEIARTNNLVEERAARDKQQFDDIHREMTAMSAQIASLSSRIQVLEGRPAPAEEPAPERPHSTERPRATYEAGKRLYDDQKWDDAAEVLRGVIRSRPRSDEAKKSQFLLGETLFAAKDYANAALEFSEFRKGHPKDNLVPNAIYRQANSFRSMAKKVEAKLFYQELIEKFPKNPLSTKAKAEMKKLK
jgi:TolA-binding protein